MLSGIEIFNFFVSDHLKAKNGIIRFFAENIKRQQSQTAKDHGKKFRSKLAASFWRYRIVWIFKAEIIMIQVLQKILRIII